MSVSFTAAVSFAYVHRIEQGGPVRSSPLRLPHLRPPHCIAVVPHCLPNSLRPRLQHLYDGAQEPDDATDVYYYPEDAYYYVKTADD